MRTIAFAVAALLGFADVSLAETWHVATTGDDAAAGSDTAPWRTIQRASDAVAPGDTVIIHAGTYTGFVVRARGTEAAPIAFVGDTGVRIDGAATADRDAVHVEGAAWVRIEGLTVTGAARAGISALDCDHITVRRNKVDANGRWGVFSSFCEDLTVEDNEASRSGTEHGIYASNSADRPVIRGNLIWGNGACGVHINGDINFGGDGMISGAVVENNVILDNGRLGGSGINGDGVTGALIRNNVLDGNHASGISLYRIDGASPSTGNRVINNTVRMATDARWAVNLQDGSSDILVRNNILLDPAPASGAINVCETCTGLVSDHNAVVGRFSVAGTVVDLAGWQARTGNDAASFVAGEAELFRDASTGDLALRAGSPAIDLGVAEAAPPLDIIGTPRPQGPAIDIGAYEYRVDDGGGGGSGSGSGGDGPDPGGGADPAPATTAGCGATEPGASVLVLLALVGLRARRRR